MIETVADLLQGIVATTVPVLDAENITHGPTIGDMYEGLTTDLLRRAVSFRGVELDVVSGFVEGDDGVQSPQMDCMVVVKGKGRPVPYTSRWVYPVKSAIAVVEVKKSLGADDITDAFGKMRAVASMPTTEVPIRDRMIRQNFRGIAQRPAPEDPNRLPNPWKSIYWILEREAALPARIVLGYHGHKTINGFRRAVARDIEQRINGGEGYSMLAMPTAVLSDQYAITKQDGLPYTAPLSDGTRWKLLASSTEPPMRVLLEVIWTRLVGRFGEAGGMFGEDLDINVMHALMDATYVADRNAWSLDLYDDLRVKIDEDRRVRPWAPVRITAQEAGVIAVMVERSDELDMTSPGAASLQSDVDSLVAKGLVGRDVLNPMRYELLTRNLVIVAAPDGLYAGENVSGRMERWLARDIERYRRG
jgi:hypothetical protein